MKQLLILSGKGGTGKTTIAGAFIKLLQARVYADCDVDAPNLHLITEWKTAPKKSDYYGLPKANIDTEKCIKCDICRQNCRFDAILVKNQYIIDNFACEGCGVCEYVCPENAISLLPAVSGQLMLYADKEKVFSTAELKMGSGTSGMLVSEVKKQMKINAPDTDIAIIDGSPGIGCPVIASLSGADLTLIVAEPSISGISDMERIIKTARQFGTCSTVCVNKYDTNLKNTKIIEDYCNQNQIPFVGKIPYDSKVAEAVNNGKSIVDVDCAAAAAVKEVFEDTIKIIAEM